jgi:hypothetical protein
MSVNSSSFAPNSVCILNIRAIVPSIASNNWSITAESRRSAARGDHTNTALTLVLTTGPGKDEAHPWLRAPIDAPDAGSSGPMRRTNDSYLWSYGRGRQVSYGRKYVNEGTRAQQTRHRSRNAHIA